MRYEDGIVSPVEFRGIIWNALLTRTASEVAAMCGVSPASVRHWLDGTTLPYPSVRVAIKEKFK